ncbi:UNVERIFIED_CONTAM: hypothetical protein FKN15_042783 [Acipenser sinensis]
MAADSKAEYSAYFQSFNQEQNEHYYTLIPHIFQKIQEMEERRIERLGESMKTFAEVDRQVIPIVGKCLDGMTKAAESIEPKSDSQLVIEAYKSGFEPPGDVEFEDYSQPMTRTVSESSLSNSRGDSKPEKSSSKSKVKLWPFKKNKLMSLLTSPHQPPPPPPASASPSPSAVPNGPQSPKQHKEPLSHRFNEFMTSKPKMHCFRSLKRGGSGPEDFSHLPPEQRRKKLQQKIDDFNKDIQKEMDQRYPFVIQGWLAEVEGRLPVKSDPPRQQSALYETQNSTPVNNNCAQDRESPDGSYTEEQSSESQIKVPTTDFDDEFDDEEPLPTIGNCKALYPFDDS